MFWADKIADEVERRYADKIAAGEAIVVRDEKTASGQVHVGSLRSAALHAIVADILRTRGHKVDFFFEIIIHFLLFIIIFFVEYHHNPLFVVEPVYCDIPQG
mgnify:CR=1 FL=1